MTRCSDLHRYNTEPESGAELNGKLNCFLKTISLPLFKQYATDCLHIIYSIFMKDIILVLTTATVVLILHSTGKFSFNQFKLTLQGF